MCSRSTVKRESFPCSMGRSLGAVLVDEGNQRLCICGVFGITHKQKTSESHWSHRPAQTPIHRAESLLFHQQDEEGMRLLWHESQKAATIYAHFKLEDSSLRLHYELTTLLFLIILLDTKWGISRHHSTYRRRNKANMSSLKLVPSHKTTLKCWARRLLCLYNMFWLLFNIALHPFKYRFCETQKNTTGMRNWPQNITQESKDVK